MNTAEIIKTLLSGDASAIIAIAPAAASIIEALEERITIMGEVLTDKEYSATAETARKRLEGRQVAGE